MKTKARNIVAKNAYKAGCRCVMHKNKKRNQKAGSVKHNHQMYSLRALIGVIKEYI